MKITVNTPDGPRTVPDWASCYCVSGHRPSYIHPYPFALPSGDELWLCPNTYHQTNTLLNLYKSLDGPPTGVAAAKFNYFVRSLITLYWQQVLEMRNEDADWEAMNFVESEWTDAEMFDFIKKVEADGSRRS